VRQFKIAVIGCGGVSNMHFNGYVNHPERIEIRSACDVDLERVQLAQQKYGFAQAFTSLEEMLDGSEWEVGVVCTPTPVRRQVVQTLAAAGKHIFVEKPFADTYAEAEEMVRICQSAGVTIAVDQNFRYHFPYEHARQLIETGLIGEITGIIHQELTFRQDKGWRIQTQRHAMSVMGVHWLDGIRRLAMSEPSTIYALTRSSPAIECAGETEAFVQIEFKNGVIASYVESFSVPHRRAETVIAGDKGALVLTYDQMELYSKENRHHPQQTWQNPYRGAAKPESAYACLNDLLSALEQGNEPPNSGRDNLKTIALLDGAYRSAQERREVLLGERLHA
jgi:predicted dehydrogenase